MDVKILDCTLRDGGYLVDKAFSHNDMKGIIDGLTGSGIDFVEIGFLQNEAKANETTVFKNAEMAGKWIPQKPNGTIYTVLADYSRYSVENLERFDGRSFNAVRVCFFKHERKDALAFMRAVVEKGYLLFVQPVDILGYSHMELLDLIEDVNETGMECFSIVDTFGSMYLDDLRTIFSLVNHNLTPKASMGFYSHNNLQMSAALSQEFINLAQNKRNAIVDTTLYGMGRGAGNTPTELMVQYVNSKLGGRYNVDMLLDIIESHIYSIYAEKSWGYSMPMFLSGCYSAHVNNVDYLLDKPSLKLQDLRFIINSLGEAERKRYDYAALEKLYIDYFKSDIDDEEQIGELKSKLKGKNVLVLAPGKSIEDENVLIKQFIEDVKPVIISVNFIPSHINTNFVYFSNVSRYNFWKYDKRFPRKEIIITSNIDAKDADHRISFKRLVKSGWNNLDNSVLMLLRLLDILETENIYIAGFDGYSQNKNYYSSEMERLISNYEQKNLEIDNMLADFIGKSNINGVKTITNSRYSNLEKF